MAARLVQSVQGNGAKSLVGTLPGDSILVSTSTTGGGPGISDSQGNVYYQIGPTVGSASGKLAVFLTSGIPGGNVTFTPAHGGDFIQVMEFSDLALGALESVASGYHSLSGGTFSYGLGPISARSSSNLILLAYATTYSGTEASYNSPSSDWSTLRAIWYKFAPPGNYNITLSGTKNGSSQIEMLLMALEVGYAPIISLPVQPGFFDISDSVLACGKPLADYDLIKIKYNADLGIVRPEAFWMGYYGAGDKLPVPASLLDGYAYSLAESLYLPVLATTNELLPGYTPGQDLLPENDNIDGRPTDQDQSGGTNPGAFIACPLAFRPEFGTLTPEGESTATGLDHMIEFYDHKGRYSHGAYAAFCFGQRQSAPLSPLLPGPVYQAKSAPSFYDLPDSAIYDDAPLTDAILQAISRNAKLSVFRFEVFFMGWYTDGNMVPAPYGAGNYAYAYNECIFIPVLGSSRQPAGDFVPGQLSFPGEANNDIITQPPNAFPYQLSVNASTGKLTSKFLGGNGVQGQGTVGVYCLAQRYPGLTMAARPVWSEISDEQLVGGQVPSAALLQQLNNNAKFAIVAKEAKFMGYFADGDTVPALVSPADGYTYAFYETLYIPILASSMPASGLAPGQKTFPALGSNPGWTYLIACPNELSISQFKSPTGKVTCKLWANGIGSFPQGVAAVYAVGTRRQNPTGTTL